MNWEAISAVGEVAGAIAVVATLLYVIRQTSTNTKAVMAQTAREVDLYIGNWHLEVARDPELKRIAAKSLSREMPEYSEIEWYEFRQFAISLMLAFQAQYMHSRLGVGASEHAQLYVNIARGMIDNFPAWSRWWEGEMDSRTFVQGFFDSVNTARGSASFNLLFPLRPPMDDRAQPRA